MVAAGPAVAIARAPQGTLTKTEYKQLTRSFAAQEKASNNSESSWRQIANACRLLSSASKLLTDSRVACLAEVAATQTVFEFPTSEEKCIRVATETITGTTTTPTTTTPTTTTPTTTGTTTGTTTVTTGTGTTTTATTTTPTTTTSLTTDPVKELVCINPLYQRIGVTVAASYTADLALHRELVSRGIKGRCLDTVGDTPHQLSTERVYAVETKKFVAAINAATNVALGKQRVTSGLAPAKVQALASAYEKAANAYFDASGLTKLSVCSHQ